MSVEQKPDSYYYPEPPETKQRGCFFYGCLIASIMVVLMLLATAVGMFFLYRFANKMVQQYTDVAPITLPASNLNDEEIDKLKERLDDFRKAADEGREVVLTLNADELNAALPLLDDDLKDRAALTIEGDDLKGQVSVPFDFPGMGKRYFNGSGTFKVSLENGVLLVIIDQAEVKGQPIPENVMEGIRQQNLAKDAYKDTDNAKTLRKIKSIVVKDGKLTITTRGPADKDEAKDADADADADKDKDEARAKPEEAAPPEAAKEKPSEPAPPPVAPAPPPEPAPAKP